MAGFTHSSYYIRNSQSPALIRARRPYIFKNAIVGLAAAGFAAGVYVYTIRAIGQDDFSDVQPPTTASASPQTPASTPTKTA